jgi:hypothetical protein
MQRGTPTWGVFGKEELKGLEPEGWLSEQRSRGERSQIRTAKEGELCHWLTTLLTELRRVNVCAFQLLIFLDITVENTRLGRSDRRM